MSFVDFINIVVYNYLWGPPMVIFILLASLFFCIKSGFFQIRHLGKIMKSCMRSLFPKKGEKQKDKEQNIEGLVSSYKAVATAIGTTVGTGNISGVATAVATGGPGAIFWMWIAGLFGMITKMMEITLAVYYREKDSLGEIHGGATYYIKKGLGIDKKWNKKITSFLVFFFLVGYFMSFLINIQTYTISESIAGTFNTSMIPIAIIFTIIAYIMISGGLRRVSNWASILVPVMGLFYIGGGLIILLKDVTVIPALFGTIIKYAFTPRAAFGGFAGVTVMRAMQTGFARSVYSNEAGWGSAPMIHASAKVNHPVKQGIMGVFEVFIDTVIICTITGLVVIKSGLWSTGLDGATLTLQAFEMGLGYFARVIVTVSIFIFGITTMTGFYLQTEVLVRGQVKSSKKLKLFITALKIIYPLLPLGITIIAELYGFTGSTIWLMADFSTALPIFVNMFTLIILVPTFIRLLNDYKARYFGIGKINPNERIFFGEENDIAKKELNEEINYILEEENEKVDI